MFGSIGRALATKGRVAGAYARGFAGTNVGKGILGGAAVGGLAGLASGQDGRGFLGGALAGAAAGGAFGRWGIRPGRNLMQRGLVRGATAVARLGNRNILQRGSGGLYGMMGNRAFTRGTEGLYNAMTSAKVGMFANKHGNKVMAGMAAGTAGLIGGSVLSSNKSY
jgi:hypothetical protein